MDLIEFLRARLAEDEATARACDMWPTPWSYRPNGSGQTVWSSNPGVSSVAVCEWSKTARHIARWDPARVLAEVAAKRQVIEYAEATEDVGLPPECWALGRYMVRALAQPYADHPDFAPAWLLTEAAMR